jgi:sugar/nucleoside kinase (ribokinase family)
VIVVVGQPYLRETEQGAALDGLAARIAAAAVTQGRSVQLVGRVGEDPEGDAVVLALAKAGVGHVALLRDAGRATPRTVVPTDGDPAEATDVPGPPTEWSSDLDAADVDLALRYLTDYAVVVLADPAGEDVVGVVADAAGWVGARLILVLPPGQDVPQRLPADVIVFEAPAADPDGVFASLVGSFAAALDDGEDPESAFRASIEVEGWAASTGG